MKVLALCIALLVPAADALSLSRISFYNATAAQTDSTPHLSACGPTRAGQIAVSRDLLKHFPCGTWVRVRTAKGKSYVGRVNDTMARRYTRTADVMVGSGRTARRLGITTGSISRLH